MNVPVKAYSATVDHDVSFHQVHDADAGRIRYQRRCEVCGKKIDYEHIEKAYDDGDQTVVITEEDFESLPEATNDEIEVVQFVPADQVDPVTLEKSYFLEPQGKSPKSYLLLREALESTDRTAVVTFALRQKTRLGVLRVQDDMLVLQGMHWADEIREVDFPATRSPARISPKEKKLARALVDQFASDFTPEDFEDTYQVELRKLIDAKLDQGEALDTEATFGETERSGDSGEDAEVIDLMEALKASLDRKRGRGRSSRSTASARGRSSKTSAASGRRGSSGKTATRSSAKAGGKTTGKAAARSSAQAGGKATGTTTGKTAAKAPAKSSGRSTRKKSGTSSTRRESA